MSDYIKRTDALDIVADNNVTGEITLNRYDKIIDGIYDIPSADVAPVRHEEDGTLWVTVRDCEKVGRVIVKNEQGHFCRVFYMGDGDEEPVRHGRREVIDAEEPRKYGCSECKRLSWYMENYCGNCGARMDGESDE